MSRKIRDIYRAHEIPKNLVRHMIAVASVGAYICDNWLQNIDRKSVIETLLLHDMGNLLKFDIAEDTLGLFDEDERDVVKWQRVLSDMKSKYGTSVHGATIKISQEVGASAEVLTLLENMGSLDFKNTLESDSWELKVISYADFRVGPDGLMSLEERFDDLVERYEERESAWRDVEINRKNKQFCVRMEKQIQGQCGVTLVDMSEDDIQNNMSTLLDWEL